MPPRLRSHTWALEYSESPAYYPALHDPRFTKQFSIKVSHEHDSDIVLTALHPLVEGGPIAPDRWERRSPSTGPLRQALVWLASNCATPNLRGELVRRLRVALPSSLPLHSVGRCLHTHDAPLLAPKPAELQGGASSASWASKVRVLSTYAFCLVTENSMARDYVSEKLFHAFAAGCVPVYYGTRSVVRMLPHPRAAIQVRSPGVISRCSLDALDALGAARVPLPLTATAHRYHSPLGFHRARLLRCSTSPLSTPLSRGCTRSLGIAPLHTSSTSRGATTPHSSVAGGDACASSRRRSARQPSQGFSARYVPPSGASEEPAYTVPSSRARGHRRKSVCGHHYARVAIPAGGAPGCCEACAAGLSVDGLTAHAIDPRRFESPHRICAGGCPCATASTLLRARA